MTMPGFDNNLFRDFLEQDQVGQRANYFSFGNQFGQAPNQNKYFQNAFGQIQDQYMGALGSQIRGGQAPTMRFEDFLSSYPWQQSYQGLPPSQRPQSFQGNLNPTTRWMT